MFAIFRVPKSLCVGGAFLAFSVALFGQTNYTISLSASPPGDGAVSGGGTFPADSTNTVTAVTNNGYAFINWTSNGIAVGSSTNYTFTLDTNVALVANFGPALTVAVSASPAQDGTVGGGGIYASNTSVTVTAMNNNGYAFTNWTLDGSVVDTNASYTFTLSNNVDLIANFVNNPVMPQGSEFSILGARPGDQVWPSLSLSSSGGCIVWQDNWIDRKGGGVGATLLDSGFNAGQPVRVNKVVTGSQLSPHVQLLTNGNIIYVWQGSVTVGGRPYIYARFSKNTAEGAAAYGPNFYTGDIQVNTYTADQQVAPAVAALPDGSAIITWASYGENGSGNMWGVYARRLTAAGKAIKADNDGSAKQFCVSQYTAYNQRNPAVATLAGGNYVIAWVSEQERSFNSVDIYARVFSPAGVPVTDEIAVNSGTSVCDAPAVAPLNDGGFTVVWAQQNAVVVTNGWDVWGRAFSAAGLPEVSDFMINTYLYGDQYAPKIAAGPSGSLVVWTSLGQDGSREGVFGRFLAGGTQVAGAEFQVNTTWISQQMQPAVAWNGVDHFLVAWTSFVGASGFDLYGQAYILNSSP
ncbi:MAG: InlB B-repeat-containing protein [Limisphaerales bacterium]